MNLSKFQNKKLCVSSIVAIVGICARLCVFTWSLPFQDWRFESIWCGLCVVGFKVNSRDVRLPNGRCSRIGQQRTVTQNLVFWSQVGTPNRSLHVSRSVNHRNGELLRPACVCIFVYLIYPCVYSGSLKISVPDHLVFVKTLCDCHVCACSRRSVSDRCKFKSPSKFYDRMNSFKCSLHLADC